MRRYVLIICLLFVYFLAVKSVSAVTTTISNLPDSITLEPFTIRVTISGANSGTNYLRIDLHEQSSDNYFGETFNGLSWYSDSDHTQYYSLNIESGNDWVGEIQGKIGNPTSAQYEGSGIYKLRVRRYTSSGNYNSTEANNSGVDVNLNIPLTITSTPNDSPSPTSMENSALISSTITAPTFNNLYISEVMIDPNAEENEWIELYNNNSFELVLENWFIDDAENSGSTPKIFSLIIPAHGYSTLNLTNSIFNNGGDSVRLLDFLEREIDSFQYESSDKNKTIGRVSINNDDFCLQDPSKNSSNNPCHNPTPTVSKISATSGPVITTSAPLQTPIVSSQSSQINSPFKFPLFNQVTSLPSQEDQVEKVLGISIEKTPLNASKNRALISSLTFASFSYSILSIISILIKVKNNF